MTTGTILGIVCLGVVTIALGVILANVLTYLLTLSIFKIASWINGIQSWYNHGRLYKDGRQAQFVPKVTMTTSNILKQGMIILIAILLAVAYIVIGLPLIH